MTLNNTRLMALMLTASLVLLGCTADPLKTASTPLLSGSEPTQAAERPSSGAADPVSTVKSSAAESSTLSVEGEGIRFFNRTTSAASPIPFGRPQDEVLLALERSRGPADEGTNLECGAGPVEFATWPDGLSLVFQSQTFAGWGLDGRSAGAISTAAGIGPGSSRQELNEAYANVEVQQTSLGTEFASGGFFGVLNGGGLDARVTDMWAGVSCVAR